MTPTDSDRYLVLQKGLVLDLSEVSFTFARSSGAGGQNVNKVNSKAVLRWPAAANTSLPEDMRERFFRRFGSRLSVDGDLIINCDQFRDQGRNRAECLERLRAMLDEVVDPPKKRKKTRPTLGSKRRRLEGKKKKGEIKQGRKPIRY